MDNDFNGDELQQAIDAITKDAANGEASSMADEMVKKNTEASTAGKVISASTDMDDGQSVFGPAPEPAVPPITDMNAPAPDNAAIGGADEIIAGPEVAGPEVAAPSEPANSTETPKTDTTEATDADAPVGSTSQPEVTETPASQPAEKAETPAVEPEEAPVAETAAPEVASSSMAADGDFGKVREEALREIYPLLEKVVKDPREKYDTYKEIFGLMKNADVAQSLLKTAESFTDEQEKADALLEILKLIGEVK